MCSTQWWLNSLTLRTVYSRTAVYAGISACNSAHQPRMVFEFSVWSVFMFWSLFLMQIPMEIRWKSSLQSRSKLKLTEPLLCRSRLICSVFLSSLGWRATWKHLDHSAMTQLIFSIARFHSQKFSWAKEKIKCGNSLILSLALSERMHITLGGNILSLSLLPHFQKQRKQNSIHLVINYLITEHKHCYCLTFIPAICQDILKFLCKIHNLMCCFSFFLSHGVSGGGEAEWWTHGLCKRNAI